MTVTITAWDRSPDGGAGLARDTRVRWALEEVGQPYDVRPVSLRANQEPATCACIPSASSCAQKIHVGGRDEEVMPIPISTRCMDQVATLRTAPWFAGAGTRRHGEYSEVDRRDQRSHVRCRLAVKPTLRAPLCARSRNSWGPSASVFSRTCRSWSSTIPASFGLVWGPGAGPASPRLPVSDIECVRATAAGQRINMPESSWTFPAKPACVTSARHRVAAYAVEHCVPEPPLEDLKLAVTEAITNAVVHAFRSSDEPGTFTVSVQVERHRSVSVIIADDGEGMTPRVDSPGLGMGLRLISALATSTELRTSRMGRGTEVYMCFDLTS